MTGGNRHITALTEPPQDLVDFPTISLTGTDWYRAHVAGRHPWWFSHDGTGRFDLHPPEGTCYLASSVEVAVRERLGPTLVRAGVITTDEADRMRVSRLRTDGTAADATAQGAARFGVTREISTTPAYGLPQRWAAGLLAARHQGLRYWPRFSPGRDFRALALFGQAGVDHALDIDADPINGHAAAAACDLAVVGVPRTLPIADPPHVDGDTAPGDS